MQTVVIIGTPDHAPNDLSYQNWAGDSFQSSNLFSHPEAALRSIWAHIDPSDIGGSATFFPTTEKKTVYIESTSHVSVTFDNIKCDNLVTQSLQTAFNEITEKTPGLITVNISATTNGHAPNSNHGVGDAIDINYANGVHIGTSGNGLAWATALEQAAMANSNVRFVEGPIGNFARDTPDSAWVKTGDLGPSQFTHVHFDVFPKK